MKSTISLLLILAVTAVAGQALADQDAAEEPVPEPPELPPPEPGDEPAAEPAEEPTEPVEEPAEAAPAEAGPPPAPTAASSEGESVEPLPPLRRKKGLMIAGIAVFGGGYVFSALVGYLLYTEAMVGEGETCLNCKETGGRMFIPLVGPFLAIPYADGADGRAVSGIMGAVQVVGVGLTVIGIILYAQSGTPEYAAGLGSEHQRLARLRIGAAPLPDGGGTLSLGWAF